MTIAFKTGELRYSMMNIPQRQGSHVQVNLEQHIPILFEPWLDAEATHPVRWASGDMALRGMEENYPRRYIKILDLRCCTREL